MNYEKLEYECQCIQEKLKEKCKEAMDILIELGCEDEITEAMDLKQNIDYYKEKIRDLTVVYDNMVEIEKEMPAYYPEEYDVLGDR